MPGLEHAPVNALTVAAFGIFGFAESWIWLVGLGLETAYLYACFTSDLQRLEAKVELGLENARMGRGTEIIATEIDMNRLFLEDSLSDFTLGAENTEQNG